MVRHSVVETKSALNFLGLGDSTCDRINCTPKVLLSANSSRVRVVHETVTLLSRIQIGLAHAREKIDALIVRLFRVFVYGVGFM